MSNEDGFENIQSLMDSIIEKHNAAKSKDAMDELRTNTVKLLDEIQKTYGLSCDETYAFLIGQLSLIFEVKIITAIMPLISLWYTQWKQSKGQ
jgi:hypothetical protein